MKILMTGATGYLGSKLAHAFLQDGHQVAILKRPTSCLDRLQGIADQIAIFDIDPDNMSAPFLKMEGADVVIHAATCYGRNGESDAEIFQANTLFPLQLLQAATGFKVRAFINTDSALNADVNAYALSKSQFSAWGKKFSDSGLIDFYNIRLEHFYGPADDDSKFVSWLFKQCNQNTPEIELTSGLQQRNFIYIDDVVSAYQQLVNKCMDLDSGWYEAGLGSSEMIRIRDLVEMIHAITGSSSRLMFGKKADRANEVQPACPELAFFNQLGWNCTTNLIAGLKKIKESIK